MQLGLEVGSGVGQPESLQLGWIAVRVLAQQYEVAGVGDQNETVALPVAADLCAIGGELGVVACGLDLQHAALRELPLLGMARRHLPGGIETEVGMSRALLGQLADAMHPGTQRAAHCVQQVRQRRILGQLASPAARRSDAAEFGEVFLNRRCQLISIRHHIPMLISPVYELRWAIFRVNWNAGGGKEVATDLGPAT